MKKADNGLAWPVSTPPPPPRQFKGQGEGARLFRLFLLSSACCRCGIRLSYSTIAWWRALRASMAGVKSNLLLREARRPRRLARVRMVSLYRTFLIRFFIIYSCYVIDRPGSSGAVVGIFAVDFWRIYTCTIAVDVTRGRGERTRAIFGSRTHALPAHYFQARLEDHIS